nr:unnamed protein product [Sorex araneus]
MNWNAKPGSAPLPPPEYPRKRSPFLEQAFRSPLGSTPQSSLAYPGQSPEACAFMGSSDLAAQPQLGHPQAQLRNYSAASMQSGALVMSQTSVERVTYATIKGPKALDHSVSQGAWLSPGLRNPVLQHPAASAMPQSSFGTKAPVVAQVLQSPFVTSDTYSMQLQMVPVSSSRAPVSCQGSSRLSPASLQDFQGHWTQQQQQQQQHCSYAGQPLPSPQHVPKHMAAEPPRAQESHAPDTRKKFGGSFRPLLPKQAENLNTLGSFCNLKVMNSISKTFHELSRASASMPGVQTVVPRRQEKRVAPCTLPPNSALDTNVTKEKLVRDIKTLVEIKNKFSELARKIKINKELLMAAGCIKTPNAPYSDPAPNRELAQKESGKVHSGSLLSLLTSGTTENKELDRVGGRPSSHGALGSGLHGPLCPEMLPVSAQAQGRPAHGSSQTPAVEGAPAAGSSTPCSSGSFAGIEQNEAADLGAPSAFPPQSLNEAEDKYLHKHPIILRLLEVGEHTAQGKLCRGTHEALPGSQPTGPEASPGAPEAKAAEHALPQDLPSPAREAHSHSDSPCSMELLATCLSLWRNSPAEPARATAREQLGTSPAASGPCGKSGLAAGAPGSRAATSPQDSAAPGAPQNHELPGVAVSKGSELQIAVVTPLVLSSAKPAAVKGGAPETVYPVIKEGSVCSLQSRLAEEVGSPAALKACVDGLKDWAGARPEDSARLCPGQQTQAAPGDGERAGENRLQIGSICSLVEGATSYNPHIAEMFTPLHPGGQYRVAMEASGPGCRTERGGLTFAQGPGTAAQEGSCENTAPDSTERGAPEDEPPVLYLHDQLSELLKEFPYGVAPVSACEEPASWRRPGRGWKRPRALKPAAAAVATEGQIQITVLSSEQMRALFPEQDLWEPDTETEAPHGELVSKERSPPVVGGEEGGQCGPQAQITEHGNKEGGPAQAECPKSKSADPQKEDLPCCALGWLSAVYEGVPQCQCSRAKSHRNPKPLKRKSGHPQPSQDTSRHKQGEGPAGKDGPRHRSPLARLDKKRPFMGSGKVRDKDKAKAKADGFCCFLSFVMLLG